MKERETVLIKKHSPKEEQRYIISTRKERSKRHSTFLGRVEVLTQAGRKKGRQIRAYDINEPSRGYKEVLGGDGRLKNVKICWDGVDTDTQPRVGEGKAAETKRNPK